VTLHALACHWSRLAASALAHPIAILAFPPLAWLYWHMRGSGDAGTFALSVAAISITQLILLAQDVDTKAIHAKLDELIHGVPDADDGLAGIERDS
jgi:low affinity Fe/Cu permease